MDNVADLHVRAMTLQRQIQQDTLALGRLQQEMTIALCGLSAIDAVVMVPTTIVPTRILRLPDVLKLIGLGRSTVWRMVKEQQFPTPCRLSPHAVGWFEADVRDWMEHRT